MEIDRQQDFASLNALAAAEASTNHWPQAVAAAGNALTLADRPGTPPETIAVSRARFDAYQQGRLP